MTIAISAEGLHPTTESCMEALQWLHHEREFRNILDMGCGNGILSVTAATIWDAHVLAVDISEKAIEDTKKMASAYQLEDVIAPIRSDGFANPLIKQNGPYDLILFNLLAEPLIKMAPLVRASLQKDGVCIMSGILAWMAADIEATYSALGFEFIKILSNTPWVTYVACHKSETGKF